MDSRNWKLIKNSKFGNNSKFLPTPFSCVFSQSFVFSLRSYFSFKDSFLTFKSITFSPLRGLPTLFSDGYLIPKTSVYLTDLFTYCSGLFCSPWLLLSPCYIFSFYLSTFMESEWQVLLMRNHNIWTCIHPIVTSPKARVRYVEFTLNNLCH